MNEVWQPFYESLPLLQQGLITTSFLWVGSLLVSGVLGLGSGYLCSKQGQLPLLSGLCNSITFVLRGVPFYVQLLMAYFVIPDLLGCRSNPLTTAIISLGICSAAYVSQTVKAGLDTIPRAQWEACQVLGYSSWQTLRWVILPQLLRSITPTLLGECDQLLKSTAIISSLGVLDLTRAGMNIISIHLNPVPVYLMLALLYLFLSTILALSGRIFARRMGYVVA
jgi:His/Glu/Gln/Arg/opine family amino acid ABC transporter permease subunit